MTTRRTVLGLVATAALAVAAVPAHATPYAGQHRYLDTYPISIHGADGASWRVQVAARVAGAVQSEPDTPVIILLSRCVSSSSCTTVGSWRQSLTAGQATVADDLSRGSLDTTALGMPLRVSLTATSQLPVGDSVSFGVNDSSDPSHVHPRVDQVYAGTGTLTIGGLTCKVPSGVLGEAVIRIDSNGPNSEHRTAPPASWPKGMLGAHASC